MSIRVFAVLSGTSARVGGAPGLLLLGLLGVGLVALAIIAVRAVRPSLLATIALLLTVFSSNWRYMHIPFGLDDVMMVIAIAAALYRIRSSRHPEQMHLRPIHLVLALTVVYVLVSSVWSQTITDRGDVFNIITSLGVFPYALFALAPVIFATPQDRRILLRGLFVLGLYLGVVAFGETVHVHALVVPGYINNPNIGIHNDRVRGPFLEASPEGFALFATGYAAAWVGMATRRPLVRTLAGVIVVLCLIGTFGTVTRAVWIGCAASALFALVLNPRLRRYTIPSVAAIAVILLVVISLDSGLSTEASSRASAQGPVWDRLNSDRAALRLFEAYPLLGAGWGTYGVKSIPYYQEADSYPLTYVGVVHNVYLSQFAELGIVGGGLWLLSILLALSEALRGSRTRDMTMWRIFAAVVLLNWAINAAFVPLVYAMPNALVWVLLGIAALPESAPAAVFAAARPGPARVPRELPAEPVPAA